VINSAAGMGTPKQRPRARPAPTPVGDETRTRILDAAERLFAERGIEAVSVRSVLAAAGVNVALAHYHFGSREGLIAELLRVRVAPLMAELSRAVEETDARGAEATLEDVLRAYFVPAARWTAERPTLSRLIAQLQSAPSPEIRTVGDDAVRGVMNQLATAVLRRLPTGLSRKQVFLRFMLAVGGPAFLARGWERLLESARRRVGSDVSFDAAMVAEEFVAFAAAGLRATSEAARRGKPS
jgi:AcrR family transcriptional regulator